jgi:hypothetical protein
MRPVGFTPTISYEQSLLGRPRLVAQCFSVGLLGISTRHKPGFSRTRFASAKSSHTHFCARQNSLAFGRLSLLGKTSSTRRSLQKSTNRHLRNGGAAETIESRPHNSATQPTNYPAISFSILPATPSSPASDSPVRLLQQASRMRNNDNRDRRQTQRRKEALLLLNCFL